MRTVCFACRAMAVRMRRDWECSRVTPAFVWRSWVCCTWLLSFLAGGGQQLPIDGAAPGGRHPLFTATAIDGWLTTSIGSLQLFRERIYRAVLSWFELRPAWYEAAASSERVREDFDALTGEPLYVWAMPTYFTLAAGGLHARLWGACICLRNLLCVSAVPRPSRRPAVVAATRFQRKRACIRWLVALRRLVVQWARAASGLPSAHAGHAAAWHEHPSWTRAGGAGRATA